MKAEISLREILEIRIALEEHINQIDTRIKECSSIRMRGYVDYWKDKLEIAKSAQKKLRDSI